MKQLTQELRYDGASLEQVAAMLADPTFREQVCDRQRVLRRTVTITPKGSGTDVRIDQVQEASGIPSFARKIVGDEINIVQTEQWSDPAHAAIQVAIPGKPGEMTGTATLTADDRGVTETVSLAVKVNIPLVGGKLEGLIADLLGKALRAEHAVGREWLAGS